jgi:hypothetical protein
MEIVVIDISGRIVSGSNLEMGTEHVMDVQITCYGCPWHSECGLNMVIWDVMGEVRQLEDMFVLTVFNHSVMILIMK